MIVVVDRRIKTCQEPLNKKNSVLIEDFALSTSDDTIDDLTP